MSKKIEKLFKSYREQLLHLAKLYGVVEIKSYAKSAKRLTISQLELLLIKNNIKLPINRSSDRAIAKEELRQNNVIGDRFCGIICHKKEISIFVTMLPSIWYINSSRLYSCKSVYSLHCIKNSDYIKKYENM